MLRQQVLGPVKSLGADGIVYVWKTKFLAHLHLLDLKTTILGGAPATDDEGEVEDASKSEEAYSSNSIVG